MGRAGCWLRIFEVLRELLIDPFPHTSSGSSLHAPCVLPPLYACLSPFLWQVRLAVPDDVMALHGLVGSMSSAMSLQEAFLHAVGKLRSSGELCTLSQHGMLSECSAWRSSGVAEHAWLWSHV